MTAILAYLVRAYAWLQSSWLGRLVIKYVKNKLMKWGKELGHQGGVKIKQFLRSIAQRKAVEKVEKDFADPKKSAEEKGKSYEEFNNTGR